MSKKSQLIENLLKFINQRPGLEFGNYGDVALYRAESRAITKQKAQALELLNFVARTESIDLTSILWEMQPRDRLAVNPETLSIEYTAGQYFPTEYRRAVRYALRCVIWTWAREHADCNTREKIQAFAKRNFSRSVAKLFN
jgi:hypothetical protein